MSVKLLAEQHLEYVSFKGGCTGSSESTLVKMPHCWKSHATAHYYDFMLYFSAFIDDMEKLCFSAGIAFPSMVRFLFYHMTSYGPRREKTCLWGIRQSEFQTRLFSYRD